MISDGAGNSYIAVNQPASIVSLRPDGSIRFQQAVSQDGGLILAMEPAGPSAFVVAQEHQITKYDLAAKIIFQVALTASPFGGTAAIAADAAGNTYVAGNYYPTDGVHGFGIVVYKLDATGRRIATYQNTTPGEPSRIAVDSGGAVYVVGHTISVANYPFPATSGALMEADPGSQANLEHGFAMRISPALDRLVYATLLAGWQADRATSLAVDGSGAVYIAGSVSTGGGNSSPLAAGLKAIGFAQRRVPVVGNVFADNGSLLGYVIKLNSSGSNLMFGAALCSPCTVQSILLAPDGRVHAVAAVALGAQSSAMLFTLSAAGDHVERSQTFNGTVPTNAPTTIPWPLDVATGTDSSIRVLGHLTSASFPVTYHEDLPPYPAVFEVPTQAPMSDIQVSGSFPYQTYIGPRGRFRVTVTNNGPGDAEWVRVDLPTERYFDQTSCTPSPAAAASQYSPGWALIPKIAAGSQVSIDCGYGPLGSGNDTSAQFSVPIVVSSLSSDMNLGNNFTIAAGPVGSGFGIAAIVPSPNNIPLVTYRSDLGFCASLVCSRSEIDSIYDTILFPEPQRWRGNLWYLDSWGDGVTDNPRTFTAGSFSPQSQLVNLRTAQAFGVDPPSLDVVAAAGQPPKARSVTLYPSLQKVQSWSVTNPGVSWLTIDPLQTGYDSFRQIDYAVLTAEASSAGLAPGTYTAAIPVTLTNANDQTTSTVNIPVSLRVMDQAPTISAVEDSASHRQTLSPGQVVTIKGSGFAPKQNPYAPLPAVGEPIYTLGGTTVVINDARAQLLDVREEQITAIVPELSPFGPFNVTVDLGGTLSVSKTLGLGLAELSPSLFTLDATGAGPVVAINADGSVNSVEQRAVRGSIVSLYGSGFFGQSSSVCSFNFVNPLILEDIDFPTDAYVGGRPAFVLYSGIAPGLVCGLQQIYIVIPDDTAPGSSVPVKLRLEKSGGGVDTWYETQDGATIAIR